MNHPDLNLELKPKLIPSILAGFEAVANHVYLIILPIWSISFSGLDPICVSKLCSNP